MYLYLYRFILFLNAFRRQNCARLQCFNTTVSGAKGIKTYWCVRECGRICRQRTARRSDHTWVLICLCSGCRFQCTALPVQITWLGLCIHVYIPCPFHIMMEMFTNVRQHGKGLAYYHTYLCSYFMLPKYCMWFMWQQPRPTWNKFAQEHTCMYSGTCESVAYLSYDESNYLMFQHQSTHVCIWRKKTLPERHALTDVLCLWGCNLKLTGNSSC